MRRSKPTAPLIHQGFWRFRRWAGAYCGGLAATLLVLATQLILATLLILLAAGPTARATEVQASELPATSTPGSTVSADTVPAERAVVNATPLDDLAALVAAAAPNTLIRLAPGHYELTPRPYSDESCGNCPDPQTKVSATVGLRISGRSIALVGNPGEPAILHTRSGYGVLFEDCQDCRLEGVTVTDGARDPDANATDAAVVVKRSRVRIAGNRLVDNIGDSGPGAILAPLDSAAADSAAAAGPSLIRRIVVGVMGVAGREGAELTLLDNQILRNSWDGVALYRGARATIRNNVIDGVDKATGDRIGGGRGVGIGLTWDAVADVRGNYVARYWKGIGVFVNAEAIVEENVVEDVATWGLTLWDAGAGQPSASFRANAVMQTGACGASISRSGPVGPARRGPVRPGGGRATGLLRAGETPAGCLIGNAFVRTGQNPRYDTGEPYCIQTAVAREAPEGDRDAPFFPIQGNAFYRNREAEGVEGRNDQADAVFRAAVEPLAARLARWPALRGSRFLAEYGKKEEVP